MAIPSFLHIKDVSCQGTDDLVGADDLYGVMGADRFTIGRFNTGDSRRVDIQRPIVAGVSSLQIFEQDDIDSDDHLGTINLAEDMDTDRSVTISQGSASYVFTLLVTGS